MSVLDGQPVNAAVTNPAFLKPDVTDYTVSLLGSQYPGTGSFVQDFKRYLNNIGAQIGLDVSTNYAAENDDTLNDYGSTSNAVPDGTVFKNAIALLSNKFALDAGDGGHTHDGTDGQGGPLVVATPSVNGVVSTSSQAFAGDKTFQDDVNVSGSLDVTGGGFISGVFTSDHEIDTASGIGYAFLSENETTSGLGGGEFACYHATLQANLAQSLALGIGMSALINVTAGSGSSTYAGMYSSLSQTGSIANDFFSFYAEAPGAMNASNYYGLYIGGVSSGTISGNNHAIHVVGGRSYFGGPIELGAYGNEQAISNGVSTFSVSFAALPNTDYSVLATIECNDASPIFLSFVIQNKSTTGFDVLLNAPTDSANYVFNWVVINT